MPQAATAGRTKIVETTTKEEIPINEDKSMGLGMPWQDFLENLSDEERAITTVTIYRYEPIAQKGFLEQSFPAEAINEAWIAKRHRGGTYGVKIYSKNGKSAFIRDVIIAGPPAPPPSSLAPVTTAAATADNAAILALLEKTIDRLDRLQAGTAQPSPAQDKALEIVADAAKMAVGIAGGQNKPQESNLDADMQRLRLMAELFKPTPPPQDKLRDAFQDAMIKKLLDPPPSQGKSLIEELKGLAELRELMGWSEGGGKAEHWTTALVNGVVQRAPELLDKLAEQNATKLEVARTELRRAEVIANARRGVATPPPSPAPVQTSANQTHAAPSPATPRPAMTPPASPLRMRPIDGGAPNTLSATAPEVVNNEPPSLAGIDTESPAIVQFVKERVVAMVQEGTPGGGIVAFLIGMRQQRFVQMLVKYTPEEIGTFLHGDPLLRQAVEHPDWADVLEEARSYVQEQEAAASAPPLVQ